MAQATQGNVSDAALAALAGLTAPKQGQGTGGVGGSQYAGVESRKTAIVNALGNVTVLGYGEVPSGKLKSVMGAQITQGVIFQASGSTGNHWAGFGEFSDYVGYVAANADHLAIGINGAIMADGKVIPAIALVKLIDVCESRRGSRYVGAEAKIWTDAATNARHAKAATVKASK